jgi:uncharacterized protein YecE (DUF72 family)
MTKEIVGRESEHEDPNLRWVSDTWISRSGCRADDALGGIIDKLHRVSRAVEFRVGTASWTDPTLVNSDLFYPPSVRNAEERLRFYAGQFDTVEADSTYYVQPAERNAKLWAERTPEGFFFNIKPFALMTQHPAEIWRLPKQLREMLPAKERNNRQPTRPSKEIVDMAF